MTKDQLATLLVAAMDYLDSDQFRSYEMEGKVTSLPPYEVIDALPIIEPAVFTKEYWLARLDEIRLEKAL